MKQTLITELFAQDFTYDLPGDSIARFPLSERDSSKLLLYREKEISEDVFQNLPGYLEIGDMLVFNNTKVIHARLLFKKSTGAEIEVFCLQPLMPSTFDEALSCVRYCVWECSVGNLKKWKDNSLSMSFVYDGQEQVLTATKVKADCMGLAVRFEWEGEITFGKVLELCGNIPIPPYLKRESEESDISRYQTVYSKWEGSVAAPTAGLHFNDDVIEDIREKRVRIEEITLHVGAGTFQPIKTEKIAEHAMHSEYFRVERRSLEQIAAKAGNIIAVGTTSVRMLESLYWLGVKSANIWKVSQWEPYEAASDVPVQEALNNLLAEMERTDKDYCYASTQIMIVPGYRFRMIKGLITNFHQPKSTLLLLIAALVGDDWKKIYDYALQHDFRFLSYGDSSLLLP